MGSNSHRLSLQYRTLAQNASTQVVAALGVYVQVPFCASKCTFCNFSSRVERSAIFGAYARAIQREIAEGPDWAAQVGIPPALFGHPVDSIYFGGGTPTLLGEVLLRGIVGALQESMRWGPDVEFTLEITPGSADASLLAALRRMEMNRLSIGAQTLDEKELRVLGRLHSVDETAALVRDARHSGFQNISLDLIAGLPYQTPESFRRSLEAVARLRPEHISLYLFEADEKSRLGREVVHGGNRYHAGSIPDEEFMAEAYEAGCEFLSREGFQQYEISNFALPGFESRHNQKYWQLAPYLGLGAGAHSFDGARRWSNLIDPRSYIAKVEAGQLPIDDFRALTGEEQVEEFFFLGLRQSQGVSLEKASQQWGPDCLKRWEAKIQTLVQDGWLIHQNGCVQMARRAYLVSNEIFQEFVSI